MNVMLIILMISQQTSDQYLRRKLTIEVRNQTIASYQEWDRFMDNKRYSIGSMVIAESKKWKCYQGGFVIPEWRFFEIAGFTEEARISEQHHKTTEILNKGGLAVTVVGFIMAGMGSNWFQSEYDDPETNKTVVLVGVGCVGVGITMGLSALGRPSKIFPVSFAVEVANNYNERLKKSLE